MGQIAELGCNKLQPDAHKVERGICGHEIEEWPNHAGDWAKGTRGRDQCDAKRSLAQHT